MKRYPAVWLVVAVCLSATSLAQDQTISLKPEGGWTATPAWAPLDKAKTWSHQFADGVATFHAADGTMLWLRYFNPELDLAKFRYITMRYRLQNTDPDLQSYFLFMRCGKRIDYRKNIVFFPKDLKHDGQWHTITTTLNDHGKLNCMIVRFASLPKLEGTLEISLLAISREPYPVPISDHAAWKAGADDAVGQPIDISGTLTTDLTAVQKDLAVADWFRKDRVLVAGLPFAAKTEGKVAAATPYKETGTATVPIGQSAREVYLLMGAQLPYRILTYPGWEPGESIDSPLRFSVKLTYADGAAEEQMPYCIDQQKHGVWRGIHAYAVAADPERQIKQMEIRDGMVFGGFYLIAATLGSKTTIPDLYADLCPTPQNGVAFASKPHVRDDKSGTVVGGSDGDVAFDLAKGCGVSSLELPVLDCRLQAVPRPLFSIREGETTWTGEAFKQTEPIHVTDKNVTVKLHCAEAKLDAELTIDLPVDGEILLHLRVRNADDKTRQLRVVFPEIALTIPDHPDDLWYALPHTSLVLSNRDQVFRDGYGHRYVLQWMDFYDRRIGGGLYVGTRTRDAVHRWYEAGKEKGVTIAKVEYIALDLPADKWQEFPPAVIGLHAGDWHAAFDRNQKWIATWYKPQVPRIDWYRRIWHLRTHWFRVDKYPQYAWLDEKTKAIRNNEMYEMEMEKFGHVDYMHFFDWRISEKYGRWGDYRHYDAIGGLDGFRRMIDFLHGKGIRVGLYLDCFLMSKKSLIGQKHGEEWCTRKQMGQLGDGYSTEEDPMYNMCLAQQGWIDYMAETCARVVKETGCDGIYLDEGGGDMPQYYCWSKDHGHAVPATTIAGCKALFTKVRGALPKDVALYTEHVPCDIVIPHLDGAYQYCHKHESLEFSPGFANVPRFAFPDFKPFMITNAGGMSDGIYDGLIHTLFNGVALYTLSYGHDPDAFALTKKCANILKTHEDAFLTMNPRMLVDSDCPGVYCNAFPGRKETVWTFWNGRYRTVRGRVLTVDHVDGATYRDVWRDQPLTPRIENGQAIIELEIGQRDVGVVVQVRAR
ncbi:MAG: DUF6259 domain-containing protein [Planctomycetota bacterium]